VKFRNRSDRAKPAVVGENLSCGARTALICTSAENDGSPLRFLELRKFLIARCAQPGAILLFASWFLLCSTTPVEGQLYAGVMTGVSTLSGDARAVLNPPSSAFSSYNPQNGLLLNALVGRDLTDFFTLQADYVWNRNGLILTAANAANAVQSGYEESRASSQNSAFATFMVYFRPRGSRIRPYLGVGTGLVHLSSTQQSITTVEGSAALPPQSFSSNMIALRVPVGIDLTVHNGWAFRYSFSENISKNPISHELSPPGPHTLKNFENLFGIVYRF